MPSGTGVTEADAAAIRAVFNQEGDQAGRSFYPVLLFVQFRWHCHGNRIWQPAGRRARLAV